MKHLIFLLFLFSTLSVFSQKNELGFSMFKLEKNSETNNHKTTAKFYTGIYYNHYYNRVFWTNIFEYGENEIKDNCNCLDGSNGNGLLKEINFSSGIGYVFFKPEKLRFISSSIILNSFAGISNYSGLFHGASSGILQRNTRYYKVGIQFALNLKIQVSKKLVLNLDAAFLNGKTKFQKNTVTTDFSINNGAFSALTYTSLKLGYQF